ncbi:hypothetical protein GobsT_31360 [Gemmata obscuriglobus]|uniref:Secreted protein n=1 Tax=Gemmata obscuriglobus TaxID=114 RepID=A0A2Z3H524_9BACT|nr:hypothetical protein [Gemmata obscuriglobus]AWM38676.1 hypothetical protein C1280_17915 [Gemmata obscuriglobus]QEG28359.1 hypothetical protein GobsT_31360 [Gemmata obscuriglobus]VTS06255.1 unnamed protein product [Gemmata obscuriglobus UQM 2246]VTS08157.1 unnamed protein product [Gemmata obscuriglobus UQM 2246]
MKTLTILRIFAVAAVAAFVTPDSASAGPIRQWVRDHRPGIIVPKRSAPSCGSCQTAPAPLPPSPITDPGLEISPFPAATAGVVQTGGCNGGTCPAPQFAPGRWYVVPAAGGCPGGTCPAPQRLVIPVK